MGGIFYVVFSFSVYVSVFVCSIEIDVIEAQQTCKKKG
jgi:hypothetical protein